MRSIVLRVVLPLVAAVCLSSCAIVIEDHAPRWKCSLMHNGISYDYTCVQDTYPVHMEYAVPEFFSMDDGRVVFRFFNKETGFELQAGNEGPFKNGKEYSFSAGDEFFDVSFGWLYEGLDFQCDGGSMTFSRNILPGIAYTVKFEFDLSSPDGSRLEIRKGVLTVYDKVEPRNAELGIK